MLKKLLILLALLVPSVASAQNLGAFENLPNTFTSTNQFTVGAQLGPVNFAGLPASPADGTIIMCTNCQTTNPCVSGGLGALAERISGVWNCATGGGGGGGGGVSAGNQYNVPVYLTTGSIVGPSAFLTQDESSGTFSTSGPGGFNITAIGTPLWIGTFGSCPSTPAGTQSAICFGTSGVIQGSQAGSAYQPFVFQNAISGSWINSGTVDFAFLDQSTLNSTYFQVTNGSGNTTAVVTAGTISGTGAGLCTDASGNATTVGCPAGSGAANTALSNVASVVAFSSDLGFGSGFGVISTSTNGNLTLAPNGTGQIVLGAASGTFSAPTFRLAGDAAGNGFYSPNSGNIFYALGGTPQFLLSSNLGFRTKAANCFQWSPSTNASGGADTGVERAAAGVIAASTSCGNTNGTFESLNYLFGSAGSHINGTSASDDISGTIVITAATSATKTFTTAYTSAPNCVITPITDPTLVGTWWVTTATTGVTANIHSSGTLTFAYFCKGAPN